MAHNPRISPKEFVELLTSTSEPCLPQTPKRKKNGVLNEESLAKHNIFVEEHVLTADGLTSLALENPQAALLTEELLDFVKILSVETYVRLSPPSQTGESCTDNVEGELSEY